MDKAVFQNEVDVGGKLKLPGECLEDGEDFAEEAVPGEELVDPALLEVFAGWVEVGDFAEGFDPCLPSPEVGLDAVAEISSCELTEAYFSGEVVLAGALDRDEVHGTKRAKHAESLADRAFAQIQTRDQIVKGQRFLAAIKKAVDFPQRARQGENSKGPDEQVDGFPLEGSQGLGRRGGQAEEKTVRLKAEDR